MSLELELKFLLAPEQAAQLPQILADITGKTGNVLQHTGSSELLNAYFDTPDNWFRRHDSGLRTRLKRGRYEQTIKLAGQQHGALQLRPEYNLPCNSVVPQLIDFPQEIWPADANVNALQHSLTELFRTDFTRTSWNLSLAEQTRAELVYDQGRIEAAGKSMPISELELELQAGSAAELFRFAASLIKSLPLQTGWLSKAARGYQLAGISALTVPLIPGQRISEQRISEQKVPEQAELAELTRLLQQTEACYLHQPRPELLQNTVYLLQRISAKLALTEVLKQWSPVIAQLIELTTAGHSPFASKEYNLLLLALAEYLLAQAPLTV